jgi:two-component system OmpR family sensor kinase
MAILYVGAEFFLQTKSQKDFDKRASIFFDILHQNEPINASLLDTLEFEKISALLDTKSLKQIPNRPPPPHKEPKRPFAPPPPKPHGKHQEMALYQYQDSFLVKIDNDYFRYTNSQHQQLVWITRIGFAILGLLLLGTYALIIKNLRNLSILKQSIDEYTVGTINTKHKLQGKDEISLLSQAFYEMAQKMDANLRARKLFLRNIMHELKTPLAKSKMYLEFLEENPKKERLENSLNKLELLIDEMAQTEKITARDFSLHPKKYLLQDIIESANELLFDEQSHSTLVNIDRFFIYGDFKLLVIVVKNLIDNAVKYSPNKQVTIKTKQNQILFVSKGEPLTKSLTHYIEPFSKDEKTKQISKGFGLGLYIVYEILKKHSFSLTYAHEDGMNIFAIETTRN